MYHGGLLEFIRKVLRCVCYNCSHILIDKDKREEIKKIKNHTARFNRATKYCDQIKECVAEGDHGGCGYKKPKYTKEGLGINVELTDDRIETQSSDRKQKLWPEKAFEILSKISFEECEIIGLNPAISRPENMII